MIVDPLIYDDGEAAKFAMVLDVVRR